ncbi:hypothetical protein [Heyndrickxia oleronia]|nr:hypothetical protein [Heyndrickxia oleronia]
MSNDNIQDRGLKKWHVFMMPEHVEELKQVLMMIEFRNMRN